MTVNVVSRPNYRAQLIAIGGFPGNSTTITAETGAVLSGWVDLKNTGAQTWPAGIVKLGTTGIRDHHSVLEASSWLSPGRVVANASAVAPGAIVRYSFEMKVPDTAGLHIDRFGLVAEGITWFADDGGPADNFITFSITAVQPQPDPDPEPDVDTSEPPDTTMDDTEVVDPADTVMTDSAITDDTDGQGTDDTDGAVQDVIAETVVGDTEDDTGLVEVTLPDTRVTDTAGPDSGTAMPAETGRVAREARTSRHTVDGEGCSGGGPGSHLLLALILAGLCLPRQAPSVL